MKERRNHVRIPESAAFELTWTENGHEHTQRVQSIDIAAGGMKVLSPEPIPSSSEVSFSMLHGDLDGVARVRYASKTDAGFVVGLEFTPETVRQLFAYSSEPDEM
ncbi:MAG: PilZ domain-containing protein [Bryobacteraceae bacterium]